MKSAALAIALAACLTASDLDDLRKTQQKLLAARDVSKLPGDETPLAEFATAKRQVLSWAESRLRKFGRNVSPADLTKALGKELDVALRPTIDDGDLDFLGAIGLQFSRPKGAPTWLQMTTNLGVQCGVDQSVYLYEWKERAWHRHFRWETEDYRFGPQTTVKVQVSAPDSKGIRFVLLSGSPPACMSVWHPLFIRLFRIGTEQKKIFEEAPLANIDEFPNSVTLEANRLDVRFISFRVDADTREFVQHFVLGADGVHRIEPVALSVRDFVDEWLQSPWDDVVAYSEPATGEVHRTLHTSNLSGEYTEMRRCTSPGEWQIGMRMDKKPWYFSVLDREEHRFKMLAVSNRSSQDCSGPNELLRR